MAESERGRIQREYRQERERIQERSSKEEDMERAELRKAKEQWKGTEEELKRALEKEYQVATGPRKLAIEKEWQELNKKKQQEIVDSKKIDPNKELAKVEKLSEVAKKRGNQRIMKLIPKMAEKKIKSATNKLNKEIERELSGEEYKAWSEVQWEKEIVPDINEMEKIGNDIYETYKPKFEKGYEDSGIGRIEERINDIRNEKARDLAQAEFDYRVALEELKRKENPGSPYKEIIWKDYGTDKQTKVAEFSYDYTPTDWFKGQIMKTYYSEIKNQYEMPKDGYKFENIKPENFVNGKGKSDFEKGGFNNFGKTIESLYDAKRLKQAELNTGKYKNTYDVRNEVFYDDVGKPHINYDSFPLNTRLLNATKEQQMEWDKGVELAKEESEKKKKEFEEKWKTTGGVYLDEFGNQMSSNYSPEWFDREYEIDRTKLDGTKKTNFEFNFGDKDSSNALLKAMGSGKKLMASPVKIGNVDTSKEELENAIKEIGLDKLKIDAGKGRLKQISNSLKVPSQTEFVLNLSNAYAKIAKGIKLDEQEIELVKWGRDNGFNINTNFEEIPRNSFLEELIRPLTKDVPKIIKDTEKGITKTIMDTEKGITNKIIKTPENKGLIEMGLIGKDKLVEKLLNEIKFNYKDKEIKDITNLFNDTEIKNIPEEIPTGPFGQIGNGIFKRNNRVFQISNAKAYSLKEAGEGLLKLKDGVIEGIDYAINDIKVLPYKKDAIEMEGNFSKEELEKIPDGAWNANEKGLFKVGNKVYLVGEPDDMSVGRIFDETSKGLAESFYYPARGSAEIGVILERGAIFNNIVNNLAESRYNEYVLMNGEPESFRINGIKSKLRLETEKMLIENGAFDSIEEMLRNRKGQLTGLNTEERSTMLGYETANIAETLASFFIPTKVGKWGGILYQGIRDPKSFETNIPMGVLMGGATKIGKDVAHLTGGRLAVEGKYRLDSLDKLRGLDKIVTAAKGVGQIGGATGLRALEMGFNTAMPAMFLYGSAEVGKQIYEYEKAGMTEEANKLRKEFLAGTAGFSVGHMVGEGITQSALEKYGLFKGEMPTWLAREPRGATLKKMMKNKPKAITVSRNDSMFWGKFSKLDSEANKLLSSKGVKKVAGMIFAITGGVKSSEHFATNQRKAYSKMGLIDKVKMKLDQTALKGIETIYKGVLQLPANDKTIKNVLKKVKLGKSLSKKDIIDVYAKAKALANIKQRPVQIFSKKQMQMVKFQEMESPMIYPDSWIKTVKTGKGKGIKLVLDKPNIKWIGMTKTGKTVVEVDYATKVKSIKRNWYDEIGYVKSMKSQKMKTFAKNRNIVGIDVTPTIIRDGGRITKGQKKYLAKVLRDKPKIEIEMETAKKGLQQSDWGAQKIKNREWYQNKEKNLLKQVRKQNKIEFDLKYKLTPKQGGKHHSDDVIWAGKQTIKKKLAPKGITKEDAEIFGHKHDTGSSGRGESDLIMEPKYGEGRLSALNLLKNKFKEKGLTKEMRVKQAQMAKTHMEILPFWGAVKERAPLKYLRGLVATQKQKWGADIDKIGGFRAKTDPKMIFDKRRLSIIPEKEIRINKLIDEHRLLSALNKFETGIKKGLNTKRMTQIKKEIVTIDPTGKLVNKYGNMKPMKNNYEEYSKTKGKEYVLSPKLPMLNKYGKTKEDESYKAYNYYKTYIPAYKYLEREDYLEKPIYKYEGKYTPKENYNLKEVYNEMEMYEPKYPVTEMYEPKYPVTEYPSPITYKPTTYLPYTYKPEFNMNVPIPTKKELITINEDRLEGYKPVVYANGRKIKIKELYPTRRMAEIRTMQLLDQYEYQEGEVEKAEGTNYTRQKTHKVFAKKFSRQGNRIYEKKQYWADSKDEKSNIMQIMKMRKG